MPEDRPVTFSSGSLALEGVLHVPDATLAPAIAVCHPHPVFGGDMYNNVVSAICETAVANGIAALRFNFRGTGRSEGTYDDGVGEQDDVRAAVAHLRQQPEVDGERLALAGYSFGAAVAARAAGPGLRAFIAVSPPTVIPLAGVQIGCPALFVSGAEDEYAYEDALKEIVGGLGPQAELKLLPGLGHFWFGVEHELQKIIAPFLKAHLGATATV